ncbi:hypothetical protein BTO06_01280 [Tenacibaculum sp. SZ-18]|uniref:hypothetical protein n=1 Tax=Tenacibaculum sp. SZ-18 TaxID=754423 RepID=UPI000C2D1148|nr:hypothetical protein [Tenacibaculum sp. SZ-18]AUC13866.1 hypothetical protein BTO06_01280 [Tenacibaculum sp. SZ-18]
MVILKKVKASSLNEVLVATVIIITVFAIAMSVLVNLMKTLNLKNNSDQRVVLNELIYMYQNDQLKTPYYVNNSKYNISVVEEIDKAVNWITFEVTTKRNNKSLVKKIIREK